MDVDVVLRLMREALLLTVVLSAPPVLAAMAVGLLVALFQAATQLQEQTLTAVPKLIAVFGVLAAAGLWMMSLMLRFTTGLLESIPRFVH